jgi:hypothetical protein
MFIQKDCPCFLVHVTFDLVHVHSIVNTFGRTYVLGIYKHALLITITKLGKVQFSIRVLVMLHQSFANATQVSLCRSNQ